MEIKENCGVCGTALIHATESVAMDCVFCGATHSALIYCPESHYICDTCHGQDAISLTRTVLRASESSSPLELFEIITAHPAVAMHGPEHHAIVPAVIIAAARNSGHPVSSKALDGALERGGKVPGGWCGFYGACGAGIGVGVAVSLLTKATPLTGETRGLSLRATAAALNAIADEYPRCCKRACRKAIEVAIDYLQEHLDIRLDRGGSAECRHSARNKECPRKACAYFPEAP